jgi:dinuclear metal center YbgI/SA1388 family protein
MPTVRDVLEALEILAPKRFAFGFDKVGLQIGDPNLAVTKAVVSLDRSQAAVNRAVETGAQLLVSHHPLIWEPLKAVTTESHAGATAHALIRQNISFIAAHTNWDSAKGGVNDTLAELLGLQNIKPFGEAAAVAQLKVVIFAPSADADKIIDAATEAGAGQIGLYSRCAFTSDGTGTYIGNEDSNPTVGQALQVERTNEVRIEMVLPMAKQRAVSKAIRKIHPYEEPALDFFQLADFPEQPIGRMGSLNETLTLRELAQHVQATLTHVTSSWGDPAKTIKRVAVCGGAADDDWRSAQRAGADVLITGEVKQHVGMEASESGFCIMAAGHYATEHPGCIKLAVDLRKRLPAIEWEVFEPKEGQAGRPF